MNLILALFGLAIAGASALVGYALRAHQDRLRDQMDRSLWPHQAAALVYDGPDRP